MDKEFIKRLVLYERPLTSGFLADHLVWNISDILTHDTTLERRAQVGYLPKIGTVQVYADHDPPHFHVIIQDQADLKFTLDTCVQIHGKPISAKQTKNLHRWYFEEYGYNKVVALWNQLNPDKKIADAEKNRS